MKRNPHPHWILVALPLLAAALAGAQTAALPDLGYRAVPDPLKLPAGANFGEVPSVALDARGHIYVFHRGPRALMEFDAAGNFLHSIGEGLFTRPHGLRIDPDGNIWTTDVGSHLVLKLNREGRVMMVFGRQNSPGETDSQFNQPADVAFGRRGEIYVADGYGNSRIVKFDREGRFLKAWGTKGAAPGQFNLPHAVVVDANGQVIVADRENARIQIFDADGNFLKEWTHVGQPWGLALSRDGLLYVAAGRDNRVLVLDLDGKIQGGFGERGKLPGQFGWPHGIAVGPVGEIYVSEILNWRVQKFVRK